MTGLTYLLGAAICLLCSSLLLRAYFRRRDRLLLWSGVCFAGLLIENVMLYLDFVVMPDTDLSLWRKLPGLAALALLVFGLVWESK